MNKEQHYQHLCKEARQWPWALLFMALVCTFIGTWFGVVMGESNVLMVCANKNVYTAHSFVYSHDYTIKCEAQI